MHAFVVPPGLTSFYNPHMNVTSSPSFSAYGTTSPTGKRSPEDAVQAQGKQQPSATAKSSGSKQSNLSPEEQDKVSKLAAIDQKVRAHEMAHLAAAGGLATSGATYSFQRGPDGQLYAVGGEVGIDTSAGKTPEETLQRAQQIRAAAMAPADPSSQDHAVAAKAGQLAAKAQQQLAQQRSENTGNQSGEKSASTTADTPSASGPVAPAGEKSSTSEQAANSHSPHPAQGSVVQHYQAIHQLGQPTAAATSTRINHYA